MDEIEKLRKECERLTIALDATREHNRKLTEELRATKSAVGKVAAPPAPPETHSSLKHTYQLLLNAHERLRARKDELLDKVGALTSRVYQLEDDLRAARKERAPIPAPRTPSTPPRDPPASGPRSAGIKRDLIYKGDKPLRSQWPIEEMP